VNLALSADDRVFQDAVRAFITAHLPTDVAQRQLSGGRLEPGDIRRWQAILNEHGYGAIHWPIAFGGQDASPLRQYLFELECALAGAPPQLSFGVRMLAPVLMRFGTAEQQRTYLPAILTGETWWCQGYSEPGAGSDLASLRTSAVLDGDHYVVNGQKCWNTLGQHADWIFCLVRTDASAKPQRGITMLLINMKTPGITVRPTVLLDGTAEVNDIYFDNVRVPVSQRVGAENEGWTIAKFLLVHERTNIAGVPWSKRDFARLLRIAKAATRQGRPLLDDPDFSRRLARLEIDLNVIEYTNLRMLSAAAGDLTTPSILKIRGSEIRQAISALTLEALGTAALRLHSVNGESAMPEDDQTRGVTASYLNLRKLSIYGGSNEIQKNIVSQLTMGL
jgi:alkylation response protein AidB-like acyl-CoA dehydrogenase